MNTFISFLFIFVSADVGLFLSLILANLVPTRPNLIRQIQAQQAQIHPHLTYDDILPQLVEYFGQEYLDIHPQLVDQFIQLIYTALMISQQLHSLAGCESVDRFRCPHYIDLVGHCGRN